MQFYDEPLNNTPLMALSFSYTDEIDETFVDSTDEDDFENSSKSNLEIK